MRAFPYQSIFNQENTPPWDRLTGATDHRIENMANWTNGVYPGNYGKVTPGAGMSVRISPIMARINGIFCYDDAEGGGLATEDKILPIDNAHENLDRIDRVVIRHDDTFLQRKTSTYILKGEPSANPKAKALTRNSTIHELCIAEIFIRRATGTISEQNITDTRLDSELCGLTTTRVMDLATEDIKTLLSAAISDTAAGALNNAINNANSSISNLSSELEISPATKNSFGLVPRDEGYHHKTLNALLLLISQKLNTLSTRLSTRRIIDHGYKNYWYYEKWSDGQLICWRNITDTYNRKNWNSWLNMYYLKITGLGNFPIPFAVEPVISVSSNAEGGGVEGRADFATTTHCTIYLYSESNVNGSIKIKTRIEAKGWWK